MIVGIDFDGTIVEHRYPDVGPPVPMALTTMRELIASGHKIILWTMRDGAYLQDAVVYLEKNGIELCGVNSNPDQDWSESPKAYCNLYIDDAALGCPLTYPGGERPYVDWTTVYNMLRSRNILPL